MSDTAAPILSRFIPDLIITPEQAALEAALDETLTLLAAVRDDPEQTRYFREQMEREHERMNEPAGERSAVN